MLNKRGVIIVLTFLVITITIFSIQIISAGPYGYGDSMDLKYRVINNKIIYGYGESTKYATSLRPSNINLSEWKPEVRREAVNLTWDEIDNIIKNNQTIEEALKDKQNNHFAPLNNIIASLVNKVSNIFLSLVGKESVSVKTENSIINTEKMCYWEGRE